MSTRINWLYCEPKDKKVIKAILAEWATAAKIFVEKQNDPLAFISFMKATLRVYGKLDDTGSPFSVRNVKVSDGHATDYKPEAEYYKLGNVLAYALDGNKGDELEAENALLRVMFGPDYSIPDIVGDMVSWAQTATSELRANKGCCLPRHLPRIVREIPKKRKIQPVLYRFG
jgi:hypothetical protein